MLHVAPRWRFRAALGAFAAAALASPAAAAGGASQVGWPPKQLLVMNKTDSSRPLDARPGFDPFGGRDPSYSCDAIHRMSSSCGPWFEPDGQGGYVVTARKHHSRLYGGHGDDTVHGGPWGDVIWGDYKPSGQPTTQRDRLTGGRGHDFIYASHGRNVIRGGPGWDAIHGHFGRGRVRCGRGRDILYVHGRHRGRWAHRGCEVVSTRTGQSAPRWLLRKLPWH